MFLYLDMFELMLEDSLSGYLKSKLVLKTAHASSLGPNRAISPGQCGEDEQIREGRAGKPKEDVDLEKVHRKQS